MRKVFLTSTFLFAFMATKAQAHCEIPCGIYDDAARFEEMFEHSRTIEKSMSEINELSNSEKIDYHSISRWTTNKEKHAEKIQNIASQYFLTQRVIIPKTDMPDKNVERYKKHTTLLHQILVKAMKSKQTTDTQAVENLNDAIEKYKTHYFAKHGHEH